jgi:flagellar biosynthesis/type III secretory pathway protein FliH
LGSEFAVLKDAVVSHFAASGTMIDVSLDTTLPPYGCVVETEVGSVDESIETRIATLLESLSDQEG